MAIKISELPAGGAIGGTEVVPAVQSGATVKSTITQIGTWIVKTFTGFIQAGTGAVARAVQDKLREHLSVADFGTPAQALTQAEASTYGQRLNIGPGSTVLTATLTGANAKFMTLSGDSERGSSLDWQGANSSSIVKLAGKATTSNMRVENMTLITTTGATGITGLQIGETSGGNVFLMLDVDQVLFQDIALGMRMYDEADELNLTRSWFFSCTDGFVTTSAGGGSCSNLNLTGNHFQGITNRAIDLSGGSRHTIIGNTIQGTSATLQGIRIDSADAITVLGNYFESQAAAATGPFVYIGPTGLAAASMSGGLISGNHVDFGTNTAGQIGIRIGFGTAFIIGGNTFTKANVCIQLDANASECVVLPNVWGTGVGTKLTDNGSNTVILDPAIGIKLPHLGIFSAPGTYRLALANNGYAAGAVYVNLGGGDFELMPGDNTGYNGANGVAKVAKLAATGRSVDAAGTLNATGTDYAEYETKAADCGTIAKGQIVGFDAEGKLTDKWSEARSFGIKTTNPSFVGGDAHGSPDSPCVADGKPLGNPPQKPRLPSKPTAAEQEKYDAELALYEREAPIFAARLEANRQIVDRVAYSGKVPITVVGAVVGDYIIAEQDGDGIGGKAIATPTFEQYQKAIGRVRRILEDGRPEVAVIVH